MHTLVARAGCAGATLRTAKGSDEAGNRGERLTLILNAVENVAVHAAQPDGVGRGKDIGIYEKVRGCIGKMRSRAQKSRSTRVAITPHPWSDFFLKQVATGGTGHARAKTVNRRLNGRSIVAGDPEHSRPGTPEQRLPHSVVYPSPLSDLLLLRSFNHDCTKMPAPTGSA